MRALRMTLAGMAILVLMVGTGGAALAQAEDTAVDEALSPSFPMGQFVSVENGRYMLEFHENGTGETSSSMGHGWTFTYGVEGDVFTWMGSEYSDLGASGEASGESSDATYRWDYDDGQLVFELVGEDAADQRKMRMSYTYQPIEDPRKVMIATLDLSVGDPIRAWEAYVPAADIGPDVYTSKVEYLGHVAAVPIAMGQPITPDVVESPAE